MFALCRELEPADRVIAVLQRLRTAATTGQPLPIIGTGKQVRGFIYVGDIVSATIAAATANVEPGFVCNIAGGSSVSVEELFPLFSEITELEIAVRHKAAQPGDVDRTGKPIDRASARRRWEPVVSLREGLEAQFAWRRTLPR